MLFRQTYKTDGPAAGNEAGHCASSQSVTVFLPQLPHQKKKKKRQNLPPSSFCGDSFDSAGCPVLTMAHRPERRRSYWSGRLTCTTTGTLVLTTVCCCWCFGLLVQPASCGNPDAKRLYDDLLSNYNKIVRPVVNNSDVLKVRIKLKLSQLIDLASVFLFFIFYFYFYFYFPPHISSLYSLKKKEKKKERIRL